MKYYNQLYKVAKAEKATEKKSKAKQEKEAARSNFEIIREKILEEAHKDRMKSFACALTMNTSRL
jgi:hypothetical protein